MLAQHAQGPEFDTSTINKKKNREPYLHSSVGRAFAWHDGSPGVPPHLYKPSSWEMKFLPSWATCKASLG